MSCGAAEDGAWAPTPPRSTEKGTHGGLLRGPTDPNGASLLQLGAWEPGSLGPRGRRVSLCAEGWGPAPGREAEGASGPGRKPQAMTSSPRPPAAAHGVFNHSDGRTSPGCARPRGSDMPHLPCAFQSLVFVWDSGEKKKNDQRSVILETNTSPHLARAGSPVAKSGVWALAGEGGGGGTRGAPTQGPPPGARTQKLGC